MRAVIQRVSKASVTIDGCTRRSIGQGLVVLVGVEDADTADDTVWLVRKIVGLRVFDDAQGVMNLALADIGGEVLLISQFTLFASTRKGNRPSYIRASKPDIAIPLYKQFVSTFRAEYPGTIETGEFGANMLVDLANDGPVTILFDTKNKE